MFFFVNNNQIELGHSVNEGLRVRLLEALYNKLVCDLKVHEPFMVCDYQAQVEQLAGQLSKFAGQSSLWSAYQTEYSELRRQQKRDHGVPLLQRNTAKASSTSDSGAPGHTSQGIFL